MKFLKNYENAWKGRPCDHVYSVIDDKCRAEYLKCIKCFRFIKNKVVGY